MKYPVLKSIAAGVLIGAAIFAFPFTIRIVGAIVFIGFLVRLIRGPRWHRYHHMHMAYANGKGFAKADFEKMTEEERENFRARMRGGCCGYSQETVVKPEEETSK